MNRLEKDQKSVVLSVRFPEKTYDFLKELSDKRGERISRTIRFLVERNFIKKKNNNA